MANFIHKELAGGRWFMLPLAEQLANIATEVGRARRCQGTDQRRFQAAVHRALDLFDLTLLDRRWKNRHYEIARARELFCAAAEGDNRYRADLADVERYFQPFALLAAKLRG